MSGNHRLARRVASVLVAGIVVSSFAVGCSSDSEGANGTTTSAPKTGTTVAVEDLADLEEGTPKVGEPSDDAGKASNGNDDENIIGGAEVNITSVPWTAALVRKGTQNNFCGGTLISPTWVMTAGHCVTGKYKDGTPYTMGPGSFDVVLGRTSLGDTGGEVIEAKNVWVSGNFDYDRLVSDYALVELASESAQPTVSLPARQDSAMWGPGADVVVAGWGCVRSWTGPDASGCEDGASGTSLKALSLKVVEPSACTSANLNFEEGTGLCLADPDGNEMQCNGDSGGPQVVWSNDRYYLVAVVSWVMNSQTYNCQTGTVMGGGLLEPLLAAGAGGLDAAALQGWKLCASDGCRAVGT